MLCDGSQGDAEALDSRCRLMGELVAGGGAGGRPTTTVASGRVLKSLDAGFGANVVGPIASVLFFDLAFWDNGTEGELKLPFIVVWLIAGATFFTLRFRFINLRAFRHAWVVTTGHYDDPGRPGRGHALPSAVLRVVGDGGTRQHRGRCGGGCHGRSWRDLLDDRRRLPRHVLEVHRMHARPDVP